MFDGFIKAACATPEIVVADCAHNAQKIIERQPDRRGVVVRMDAHTRISFKRPVEYNFDGGVRIVDNTERRHLSTDQPQISLQALRGRKAQSCRAELRFN